MRDRRNAVTICARMNGDSKRRNFVVSQRLPGNKAKGRQGEKLKYKKPQRQSSAIEEEVNVAQEADDESLDPLLWGIELTPCISRRTATLCY